jgi:hypothetical protein
LKRYAIRARPFTRPESATSVTTPASEAPVGTTVLRRRPPLPAPWR